MSLSSAGALGGAPTVTGAFSFTITATDTFGCTGSRAYGLTVNCPVISLSPPTLPAGTTGSPYSQSITASGGVGSTVFTISSGALPTGVTLSAGGSLSGTPTASGSFTFRVRATDANGCNDSLSYTLAVNCPAITLSPASLPAGTAGSAYSQIISASGGTAPRTYAVTGGSLPSGLSLSASGTLGGTPTVTGAFSFTITATDTFGCTGSRAYGLTINCPVISLSPPTLPAGTTGAPYSQTITASGGVGSYAFSLSSGALPAGMTLSVGGGLAGTPTVSGSFPFKVRATDANGCSDSLSYTLAVNCPVITLSAATLPSGTTGSTYSQTLTASGGVGPYAFSISSGAPPAGVTLSSGGALAGTPTVSGSFTFRVRATDANGCSDSLAYSLAVNCPTITLSPTSLPAGLNGTAYSQSISASGGVAPYAFAVTSGSLPSGMSLTSAGALGGTPTVAGAFSFTVTATDTFGCTGSRAYTLTLSCPVITLSPPTLPTGTSGAAYSQTVSASGGVGPYAFALSSGVLPSGVTLSSIGALSGTPTVTGSFTFTVRATDANGCSDSLAYALTVNCATITLSPPTVPAGTTGSPYSQGVSATGGIGAYTYSLSSGALPAGVTLSASGLLAGTPTASGTFTFTVRATDANGCSDSLAYALTVNCAVITLSPPALGAGTTGSPYSQSISAAGGIGTYAYSLSSGALPSRMTLSSGGLLAGTPTVSGAFNFTVRATDANGCSDSLAYALTVGCPTITLSPTTLPAGSTGAAYAQTITSSGGTAPYTYSLSGGALPAGVSLSSAGALTGTPTVTGAFSFTVTATDTFGCSGSRAYGLTIGCAVITLSPATLPAGTTGSSYSQTLGASGGVGSYVFSLSSGALPAGLTLAPGGALTGTPTVSGAFTFTVRATDANGCSDSLGYALTVNCPIITFSPSTLPAGTTGSAYSQTVAASGGVAPYSFAVTAGSLPAGLSLSSAGALTGTPTVSGSFTFTIRAIDVNGCGDSSAYALTVDCPLIALSPPTLGPGLNGIPYSQTITASGGSAPYAFRSNGTLPAGLALSSGGLLSGTPTANGSASFFVIATDVNGCADSLQYTLTIGDCPVITVGPAFPDGSVGSGYAQSIAASGGVAPYTYTHSGGALPAGLSFAAGQLSGTPTTPGKYAFDITVLDANLCSTVFTDTVVVCGTVALLPASPLPSGTAGTAYSQAITASGSSAPYLFALTAGSLPAGMSLSSAGALTGTPTVTGAFSFTVTATDTFGCTGSLAYALTIGCPVITLSPPTLNAGTTGSAYSQTISASGGIGSTTFALSSGALPAGLALASDGTLAGTPTVSGAFTFRVRATDANGCSDSLAYALTVNCPVITLSPAALPAGTTGSAYSQTIAASGGVAPYSFAVTAGSLPAGLSLSSAGALVGTPTTPGSSSFTIRAVDANGCGDTLAYTVSMNCPLITLSPPTLGPGLNGIPYSQTLSAGGGSAPYTFRVNGALPAGLSISSGGVLSGTPTANGSATFYAVATASNGCADSVQYTLTIGDCPVITAGPALPDGSVGSGYSQSIAASGGVAPYTYAQSGGTLPPGLVFAAGLLSGTPTAPGKYPFGVTIQDANFCTTVYADTVIICGPVALAPASPLPNGTAGAPYSQAITASGSSAPYTFAVTSGSLPSGMSLSSSGALGGTPTVTGAFSFTVTATDTFGCTGSLAYALTIGCPVITLSPPTLNAGTTGSAYSQTISASGGIGSTAFTLSSGALPAGVTLSAGGLLAGTPTVSGAFTFRVRATDANGCSDSLAYALTINCPVITLSPATLPQGLDGIPYAQTISAGGGTAPYAYRSSGTLPPGLSVSSAGALSGTPTANGSFPFFVVATDANGCADSLQYTITVGTCPVVTVGPPFPDGSVGAAYAHTIAASGGVAPYTYVHSAGTLPPGLTFAADQLSGTPTSPGKYPFDITIQDANFCTTVYADTVIICGTIALSPASVLPAGTAGSAYAQAITASGSSAPYAYAVTAGTLPTGLTLSPAGALSGTPTVTGAFAFTVTATDTFGCTGSLAYALTVNCPVITLSPPALPAGTTGSAYSQAITAGGGIGTTAFTLSSGALPAGMTLAPGGALSGTPTVTGSFSFRVRATDANGCSDSLAYVLTVNCPTVSFTAGALPIGFLASAYSASVTATGGTAPYAYSLTGSLPTGLALSPAGAITGTPGAAGKFVFTLTATDLYGCSGSRPDSITILTAAVTSVASGSWSAGSTWSQGVKPGPNQNVVISGGNTVTLTANDTCASVTVLNAGVLDIGTFTLGLSGGYTLLAGAEGRQSAANPVPGRGATPWSFDPASTYTVGGASTGLSIGAASGITFGNFNWNTSGAGALPGGTVIAGNLILGGSGELQCGSGVVSRTISVLGNVLVINGTLVASASTAPATGTLDIGGNLTVNANGTLRGVNADGAGTMKIGGSLINSGGRIHTGDGSGDTGDFTVYFKGTGAGFISPGDSSVFRTISIAPGRSMTLTDSVTVSAGYVMTDSGALYCGLNTIGGAGGFTLTANASLATAHPQGISRSAATGSIRVTGPRTFPAAGAGSYQYNGTAAQLATDSTLFSAGTLIINNPAGVTLINDFHVSGQLMLQNGLLTVAGGKLLSLGAAATVVRTSGHVVGRLSKNIAAGASVSQSFEIGDAGAFTPVDMTFQNVALAESVVVSTTAGEHPAIGSSGVVTSRDVNRYYTIVNRGVAFASADATFHFAPGDVDGGANTANFTVGKYDAPNWSYPASGVRTATSTQATGLTSFSDFAVGEIVLQTITVTHGANGVISPGTTTVVNGATQAFSITPNPGYIVDSVFVDGVYRAGTTTSFTFTNVTASHSLTAKFIAATFTITVTPSANGTVTPGTSIVPAHANITFFFTAGPGYHLDTLFIDGVRVPAAASYDFANVRASHTLRAAFVLTTFPITVTQGAHGVIAPGTSLVPQFGSKAFTITPATGYHLDSLLVDGVKVDSTVSYTFKNVTAAHTLRAVFSINMYTLSVTTVGGGTVKLVPNQALYAHGTALTMTALADTGWAFSFWSVGAAGSTNPLGITMTASRSVTATFVRDSTYDSAFRSFAPESIAVARDTKGYIGKYVSRTPDKVDYKFSLKAPADSIRLTLRFTAFNTGAITRASAPTDTLLRWRNRKYITGVVRVASGEAVEIGGRSTTGLPVRTTYDWSTRPAHTKGIVSAYLENQPRLPMPNRVNVLAESFEQGGFASTGGLLVGLDRTLDSARHFGWLLAPRYPDVLRTLYSVAESQQQTGRPRGFDTFVDGKPILHRQRSIYPTEHSNALLAEMVAVKFTIVASALEKIPLGFGELVYNDGTANPLNGLMIKQIAAVADTAMMGYYAFNVHQFADSAVFANLYATLDTINDAFEGPIDTVDFANGLHLTGVRQLRDVPYLRAGTVPPSRIIPRYIPEMEEPVAFRLSQNYPNPFNPTTTISFELPIPSLVTLKVYNMLGQEVATILDGEELEDGTHDVAFNASSLASGVYFYRITADGRADPAQGIDGDFFTSVKKMLLVK